MVRYSFFIFNTKLQQNELLLPVYLSLFLSPCFFFYLFLYLRLCIWLCPHLSHASVTPFYCLFLYMSAFLCLSLYLSLSLCIFLSLSWSPFISPSVNSLSFFCYPSFVCLPACLPVCLSISLPVCLLILLSKSLVSPSLSSRPKRAYLTFTLGDGFMS